MISENLLPLLKNNAQELFFACDHDHGLFEERRYSLEALFGVSSKDIEAVESLLQIKYLEEKLSDKRPYITVLPYASSEIYFNTNWVGFPGGANVQHSALQELSCHDLSSDDQLLICEIIKLIPRDYFLVIRRDG